MSTEEKKQRMRPHEVRAQFPSDPDEWNGVDLTKMKPLHKAINRELVSSGMNFREVAKKYGYEIGSMYHLGRQPKSKAYRAWLGESGRQNEIADAQEVLRRLTDVLREDNYDEHVTPGGDIVIKKNDTKEVLKAAEILTKVYGMQIDKKETINTTIVVDIEGIDDDGGDVIDV